MKAMLLRVGIDTGYGANALSPIFDDGSFEYIPIPKDMTMIPKKTKLMVPQK